MHLLPVISHARARSAPRAAGRRCADLAARRRLDQLPGSHRDRRRHRSGYRGRSGVLSLRIRRHRAAVFILGDRAREAIGRRHGARAEGSLAAPAESLVAGATANARPLRPLLRWARSLRDRASGCRCDPRLNLLPKRGPVASASCHFSRAREARRASPGGVALTSRPTPAGSAAG